MTGRRVGGGWRVGDPVGQRRFASLGRLPLESGAVLPEVTLAYESWGTPAPDRSNAVLVLHALTGDSHVVGRAGDGHPTPGWWEGLVGPGRPLDTDRWWVVAPNVLGGCQGSTGPSSPAPDGRPWGSRWPSITVRDQVAAEALLADALGISCWALIVGGSMGGMRAVEWAVTHPDRTGGLVALATSAAASAEQIALCSVQIDTLQADPRWQGGDYYDDPDGLGPQTGLDLARRLAHISYRSEKELAVRFGRTLQSEVDGSGRGELLVDGRLSQFAVESYLAHHGRKLSARFDAGSYVTLTQAMNSHDVGRGRGGVAAALAQTNVPALVIAIDSDRLYRPYQQRELAQHLPQARYVEIPSDYGHDGFLLETAAVGTHVRAFLEELCGAQQVARAC